jgi:hypothetical protein
VNKLRGAEAPVVSWGDEAMARLARDALLRYLAVAHFGRGRGAWREVGAPAHWGPVVDAALAAHPATPTPPPSASLLRACMVDVLQRLYPGEGAPAPRA